MRIQIFFNRSLSFTYLSDTEVKGLKAYRFWADDKQLDNGKYDADNKCFCPEGICLPAGAINVSSCKFGIVLFLYHYFLKIHVTLTTLLKYLFYSF